MGNNIVKVVLAIAFLAITACSKDRLEGGIETVTYRIAVVMPSSSGTDWSRSVDWALQNYGLAQQGLSRKVIIDVEFKDENDSDLRDYLQKIAGDESYSAIVGPYSSANAIVAAEACESTGKTLILPIATSTEFQRSYADRNYVWNLSQSDLTQSEILLMQAAMSDMDEVTLITSEDDYGKSFSDWFAYQAVEIGLEVEGMFIYSSSEEIADYVSKIEENGSYTGRMLLFAPSQAEDVLVFDEAYSSVDKERFPVVYCSDVVFSKSLEGKLENNYEGVAPSADPSCGFIQAYQSRFGETTMAGEAHLYDAVSLLAYAFATNPDAELNESIKLVISGRDSWNRSWLPDDMRAAILELQSGKSLDLRGVTGDWTFDQRYNSTVLNSIYCHWAYVNGEYQTLEYLSVDGSGRTTSTLQTWEMQASNIQEFSGAQKDFEYPELEGNWAVVIGTSDTWANYRHQADALAMYQILKRHGYDDDHIILIIADNLAYDPNNLYPGEVRVTPDGENLYTDVEVDYKIGDIGISDLKNIMLGVASDKLTDVINPGPNDNVIVFWCGHGSPSHLSWGSYGSVYPWQIKDILQAMHDSECYRKVLFSMDTCYSGIVGSACEGLPGVLFITSANAYEPSKADMRDPEMGVWLSNGFTRAFQEAIDENPGISLRDLYYTLAAQTVGSHATIYNIENYGNMYTNSIGEYLR